MISPAYINRLASIHPNGRNEEKQTGLKASEPDYKTLIPNPMLRRRMSHVIKMGVACGLECIGETPKEDIQAIITATGLGCLADTEKFMNTLLDNNEQLLNPTAFIQSTFNTIGAQIALLCGNQAYNVTYVHRGFSFESALLDALLRLEEGDRNVLAGAFDEITPTSCILQERMGRLRETVAGEGAQFFLLSKEKNDHSYAKIAAPYTFFTPEPLSVHIRRYLDSYGLTPADIDLFVSGKNGNQTHDAVYSTLENELFPHARKTTFKENCGEYPTASAFAVWQTASRMQEEQTGHALICNHHSSSNPSLILISKP